MSSKPVEPLRPEDRQTIHNIAVKNNVVKGAAIPILQEVQSKLGYVSKEALQVISDSTGLPASDLYSIVTFYSQFRLEPLGEHTVKVCHGTACHLAGADKITQSIEMATGAKEGQTSPDGKFTHERVACLGCCSLAPVLMVGEEVHARLEPGKIRRLVADILERHENGLARLYLEFCSVYR